MKFQLRKCPECESYTLKEECQKCNIKTVTAHPAKFSPDDKYARYRIMNKFKEDRKSTRLNSSHSQQSRMPSSA